MRILGAAQLDWVDWLSVVSSVISVATVIWFLIGLLARLRRASFSQALQEFDLLARRSWHIVMFLLITVSTMVLVFFPPSDFPASLLILVPVVGSLLLLLSFFLAQNNRLVRNIILNEIRKTIVQVSRKRYQACSAVRFDIDRIVAINDYSYTVGTHILELVRETINEEARQLAGRGTEATVVNIPESDEMILILPGMTVDAAADVADEIRRRVKSRLPAIPHYAQAREFVVTKQRNPPLTDEEKESIGTLSAGVAAYARGEEALLSDISSAVKESKLLGRNKTVIHNHGGPSTVRGDYVPEQRG